VTAGEEKTNNKKKVRLKNRLIRTVFFQE